MQEEILFAKVKNVSPEGLEIEFKDGEKGWVPLDQIFVGTDSPVILKSLAYVHPVSVIIGQTIPVSPIANTEDRYSRASAVVRSVELASPGEIVEATITEITDENLYGVSDRGFDVKIPLGLTQEALEREFSARRLNPQHEREDCWLYVHDRIKVQIGEKISESRMSGELALREMPDFDADYDQRPALVSEPPIAPETRYSDVLIVDNIQADIEDINLYFRDAAYRVHSAMDFQQVQSWLRTFVTELRSQDKQQENTTGTTKANGKTPREESTPRRNFEGLLALVRMDTLRFSWEEICDFLRKEISPLDVIVSYRSERFFNQEAQKRYLARREECHIIGVWHRSSGLEALTSTLNRQSELAQQIASQEMTTGSKHSGSSAPVKPARNGSQYRTLKEDVRTALQSWVEAAGPEAMPCAAILFRIHRKGHTVEMVSSFGEPAIVKGFEGYLRDLHKSPIRDLAIYRQSTVTGDAKKNPGRYIYFLDAVGGPDQDLSVIGIRPTAPATSPYAYAAFLLSTKREAFGDNQRLTKDFLNALCRSIETALLAEALSERVQRMQEFAERAADFQYMAHEAIRSLSGSVETVSQYPLGSALKGQDLDRVRDGLIRSSVILDQLLPDKQIEPESFDPRGVAETFLDLYEQLEQKHNKVQEESASNTLQTTRKIQIDRTGLLPPSAKVEGMRLVYECVLRNLILNARQQIEEYCKGEGKLDIRQSIEYQSDGQPVLVTAIADNGPGIHGQYWEQIFQPGVTTRERGTGLGLAVSRKLVSHAGGALSLLDSFLYSGTIFRVSLPVTVIAE